MKPYLKMLTVVMMICLTGCQNLRKTRTIECPIPPTWVTGEFNNWSTVHKRQVLSIIDEGIKREDCDWTENTVFHVAKDTQ